MKKTAAIQSNKKTVPIAIRISVDLLERIDNACDNRSKFFIEAAHQKLNPIQLDEDLTDREQQLAIKGAKNLTDIMQDLILQETSRRKNFLGKMDDETFAKLVASRLPKENLDNGDLESEVLSLRECLSALPTIEDITQELNRVKGLLFKAERERDLNKKLLEHGKGKADLGELMDLVFRGAVEYCVNLIARRQLPGFGDGGGLTDKAYSDISADVKRSLEKLEIYRRKS